VQTIVIDNASNDGTVGYIREHFPEIHLIESKENLGFGRANNLGMRYALDHDCDYVFLLNQDAWIEPDSISELVKIHELYPEYGVLSPMHVTADKKGLYIEIEDGKKDHANSLLSDCYFQSLKDVYTFKYINAAAWLMTRKTLETIGGFDPIFFLYGEDDNYLQRMEYHGVKLGLVPKTQIIHDHQESENSKTKNYKLYRAEQSKLVEYTNILKPFSANKYAMYLYRKWILNFLSVDNTERRRIYNEIVFFNKFKQQVRRSRNVNKQKGLAWL
jgi:GT2 family glycosyltransferase